MTQIKESQCRSSIMDRLGPCCPCRDPGSMFPVQHRPLAQLSPHFGLHTPISEGADSQALLLQHQISLHLCAKPQVQKDPSVVWRWWALPGSRAEKSGPCFISKTSAARDGHLSSGTCSIHHLNPSPPPNPSSHLIFHPDSWKTTLKWWNSSWVQRWVPTYI